jgi:tetratricopeptide (TPR) repeat protein
MATSLRPLADEAQNIDEITRLLSQQKLTTNPNLHSVTILRNLIKSQNPEIALYAAEGLNSIENTFIEKIQRIKDRLIDPGVFIGNTQKINGLNNTVGKDNNDVYNKSIKKVTKKYILYYLLGLLYLEFARLLQGQHLIQKFYLNEAVSSLQTANELNQNNKRILVQLGECYLLIGQNETAINIFTDLFSKYNRDRVLLMRLAECYYNIRDYENVLILAKLASKTGMELDEISNLIIYQWLLNT